MRVVPSDVNLEGLKSFPQCACLLHERAGGRHRVDFALRHIDIVACSTQSRLRLDHASLLRLRVRGQVGDALLALKPLHGGDVGGVVVLAQRPADQIVANKSSCVRDRLGEPMAGSGGPDRAVSPERATSVGGC